MKTALAAAVKQNQISTVAKENGDVFPSQNFSPPFLNQPEPSAVVSGAGRRVRKVIIIYYYFLHRLLVELMGQKHSQSDVTINYLWYRLVYDQIAS